MPDNIYKKDIFDIIENYYISQIIIFLSRKYFFKDLNKRNKILNNEQYSDIFKILSERTDLIEKAKHNTFRLNNKYNTFLSLDFHIEKFLLAYGNFSFQKSYPLIIRNDYLFKRAFEHASLYQNWDFLIKLIRDLKVKNILDLGCGPGNLLIQFCKQNSDYTAIGIEKNKLLVSHVNKCIRKLGQKSNAKVLNGDLLKFDKLLTQKEINKIEAIIGTNIFNEFYSNNGKEVTCLLDKLKNSFLNKYLIILDYYQIFETKKSASISMKHSYVNDLMQILSGQGLSPSNFSGWNKYYKKSGCKVIYVYEGEQNGISWFVHILKL